LPTSDNSEGRNQSSATPVGTLLVRCYLNVIYIMLRIIIMLQGYNVNTRLFITL